MASGVENAKCWALPAVKKKHLELSSGGFQHLAEGAGKRLGLFLSPAGDLSSAPPGTVHASRALSTDAVFWLQSVGSRVGPARALLMELGAAFPGINSSRLQGELLWPSPAR